MAKNKEVVQIAIDEMWDRAAVNRLFARYLIGPKAAEHLAYRITKAAKNAVLNVEKRAKQKR